MSISIYNQKHEKHTGQYWQARLSISQWATLKTSRNDFSSAEENTFVNWTRLEQDSNSSFTETLNKLLRRIWAMYYALLSAKSFLDRRHWFGWSSQTQKFPFSKPQLSCKWDRIYSVKFSARGGGGHNISSFPRVPRTKPNLEMGARPLSIFLVMSSTEEHQDLIQHFQLLASTTAISNITVWGFK